MMVDAVIVVVLVLALLVGYQRGLVQPLLAEAFFLIALLIIIDRRHQYAAFMQAHVHGGAAIDVFVALVIAILAGYLGGRLGSLIHHLPVVRGVDGFFGVFVHAAIAVAVLYLVVSAMISLDRAFGPISNAVNLTGKQVAQVERVMASAPVIGGAIDPREYQRLQREAKGAGGAQLATASQLHILEQIDVGFLQAQLRSSHLARYVLAVGVHFPLIGHLGPTDLPQAR